MTGNILIIWILRRENVRHRLASSLQNYKLSCLYLCYFVERMFAISWPLRYRTTNFRVYICAIALPWIIAATLTITVFVNANFNSITRYSVICPIVLFPATPLLVMCVAYYVIWRKQKSPICNHKKCHQRGQISKHTIFDYRSFCFHLTSIPDSEPVGIFSNNCKRFSSANSVKLIVIRVLQYSNSFVNVIIYPLIIPEFKNCLLHLLRCCVVPNQIFRAGVLPSAESGSVVSLVRFTSTQRLSPSSK